MVFSIGYKITKKKWFFILFKFSINNISKSSLISQKICSFAHENKIVLFMRLSELQTGDKAYIVKVNGSGAFRKRILEMGLYAVRRLNHIERPVERSHQMRQWSMRSHWRSEAVLIEISKLIEDAMYGPENDEPDELGI